MEQESYSLYSAGRGRGVLKYIEGTLKTRAKGVHRQCREGCCCYNTQLLSSLQLKCGCVQFHVRICAQGMSTLLHDSS